MKIGNDYLKVYDRGFRIFKALEGFDPTYCDESIFPTYILRSLNLPVHVLGFEHKAMYDQVFAGLKKPKTIFKCVNGVLFDSSMNIISIDKAFQLVKDYTAICVKLTTFSACGQGVRKIDIEGLTFDAFVEEMESFGNNYIAQELLLQSPKMSQLSESSLNTFRVSSLFINGKCSICTILNRIGRGSSFVDNGLAGNYCIGVDVDGKYRDYAYDKEFNKYSKTDTGVEYKDFKIEAISDLVDLVLSAHPKYLPHCGFCGWDFALDDKGDWNLIEVNLYAPGIEIEQICAGRSIFGERTQEVIDYVNSHQPSLLAIMTSLGYA